MPLFRRPHKPARRSVKKTPVQQPERIIKEPVFSNWEMLIAWDKSLNKSPQTQRFGFKITGTFEDATKDALEWVRKMNALYGRTLAEIEQSKFCVLIAVYRADAFKDYSQEPIYSREARQKQIKKHVESVKEYDKTQSTKIPRNSVKTIRVQ